MIKFFDQHKRITYIGKWQYNRIYVYVVCTYVVSIPPFPSDMYDKYVQCTCVSKAKVLYIAKKQTVECTASICKHFSNTKRAVFMHAFVQRM